MEQELIQAILNGQTQRYSEIVDEYQDMVANVCYKIAGKDIDIEEVSQCVFVALYDSLPRFRFKSKLSTFIYRITVNVISKELKKGKRYVQQDPSDLNRESSDSTVEEILIRNDRMNELHNAIAKLKYEQRVALTMFYFEELSYKEIAEVMDISLAKTETLIFRAKKNLKEILSNQK